MSNTYEEKLMKEHEENVVKLYDALKNGKRSCIIDFPQRKGIRAEIIFVDVQNIHKHPNYPYTIKVEFKDTIYASRLVKNEKSNSTIFMIETDYPDEYEYKKVKIESDFIKLEYIKGYY